MATLKNGVERPLQHRPAALQALTTLLTSHWSSGTAPNMSKMLPPILKEPNSLINQFAAVNESNIAHYIPVYTALLDSPACWTFLTKHGLSADPTSALWVSMLRLALHPLRAIRQKVTDMLLDVMERRSPHIEDLRATLLRSLHLLLYSTQPVPPTAVEAPAINDEQRAYMYRRLLFTLSHRSSLQHMPYAFFLSHDPALSVKTTHIPSGHMDPSAAALIARWTSPQRAPGVRGKAIANTDMNDEAPGQKKSKHADREARDRVRQLIADRWDELEKLLRGPLGLGTANASTLLAELTASGSPASSPASSSANTARGHPSASSSSSPTSSSSSSPSIGDMAESSRQARQHSTSVSCLLSLTALLPSVVHRRLIPSLISMLDNELVAKLSDHDWAIYTSEEGTLCEFVAEGEFKAVEVTATKRRDKDWTEEDERLERIAQERKAKEAAAAAARKPGGKPGAAGKAGAGGKPGAKSAPLTGQAKVEAERAKRIEEQSAIRARLHAARMSVEPILSFFSQLAIRHPQFMHDHVLPDVLPKIESLIPNRLVRDSAIQMHRNIVKCLDSHVASIGSRLSLSVETLLLQKGNKAFENPAHKRLIANTLAELRHAAKRRPFSAATFRFVFPIIDAAIMHSSDPEQESGEDGKNTQPGAAGEDESENASPAARKARRGDEEDDEEEFEENDDEYDEKEESKEEEKSNGDDDASPSASRARIGANDEDEAKDLERPLAPGLQLGLSCAADVLQVHCKAELHAPTANEEEKRAEGEEHKDAADSPLAPPTRHFTPFPLSSMYSALLHLLAHVNALYRSSFDALLELSSSEGIPATATLPLLSQEGVLSPFESIRLSAVKACALLRCFKPRAGRENDVQHFRLFTQRMWIACHDPNVEVSSAASGVWESYQLRIDASYLPELISLLAEKESVVRAAVGSSLASALQLYPDSVSATLAQLIDLFKSSPDEVISSNERGLRQGKEHIYRWTTRSGVAQALGACTDVLGQPELLEALFDFFIHHALREMNDRVWEEVLTASVRLINVHGKQQMDVLLPLLQRFLADDAQKMKQRAEQDAVAEAAARAAASASSKKKAGASAVPAEPAYAEYNEEEELANDRVREGVIICLGTLARHMDPDDASLVAAVERLLECLSTPSHSVQKSIAECLPPLMTFPALAESIPNWIDMLIERLGTGEDYGTRLGAAFGLGGMVKGLKLASLKKYNILDRLSQMVQDKASAHARQGALFAYERLFHELGSRFEPYVVQILPHLLACYGDPSGEVREATTGAARVIMSHLTGHGIKMVLPLVLQALEEKNWRTKLESISLLSAMAHCSPAQLSACLPTIVPRLLDVMTDANAKVQNASKQALKQIGSVIRAPEILTLVPVIMAALHDPSTHTKRALQELMRTSFVHSVDPPSLALIIPILRKGLKGRTAATKKMAAQVVGSMCSLIGDVKDILPYAPALLKYLKVVLVDPNPEVRAVAARALAALYKGIMSDEDVGSSVEGFVDLREWLLATLRSNDTTPTIRSGCAQGLAQLLGVQGLEATSQLLPSLFLETKNERAVVREGMFDLFGYLPDAFQQQFSIFVADVLPVIVAGLSDEIGLVREAALAAGQSLVLNFASSKTELLLPALEDGIVDPDWRIRLSSVQLLGMLLLRLAGVSIKMIVGAANMADEGDDDSKSVATICTREQENVIEKVLGTDRRNRLFSTVYLMRCDQVPAVADMAFRAWKAVVSNSPRMITTLLPVLMSIIISDLASDREDRQYAAGRTLGELVSRMGDIILSEIVPILQQRLESDDAYTRQGVCLGLSEVMASSRKNDLAAYMADLIPSVRDALCDGDEMVRKAAGTCFQTLLRAVGRRAVDDIVPALLHTLDEEQGDAYKSNLVLEGMRQVLAINSADVLPYLIPALAKTPLTLFHAKTIAFLAPNISKGFLRYVEQVTNALIDGLSRCNADELDEMRQACAQIVTCISQECVHMFANCCEEASSSTKNPSIKAAVAHLISAFAANTRTNYESHLPLLLQILLRLFVEEENPELVQIGWDALDVMMRAHTDEKLSKHIVFVRSVIGDLRIDSTTGKERALVPGFCLKKGIQPLLPMFQHGLMHGTPQLRVEAADGLSDLIELTSDAALSPFVIKMTGPLIRIVGDRFPGEVKSAILYTLHLLLQKSPKQLKPFLPQLQTTFSKALNDSTSGEVRSRAGLAMVELVAAEPRRSTAVINELCNAIQGDINPIIKTSMAQTLTGIVSNQDAAATLTADLINKIATLSLQRITDDKESVRRECARLFATCAATPLLADDEFTAMLNEKVINTAPERWEDKEGVVMTIQATARLCSEKVESFGRQKLISFVLPYLEDDHPNVIAACIHAVGELMLVSARVGDTESVVSLAQSLVPLLQSDAATLRQEAARRFQLLGESSVEGSLAVLDVAIPALLTRSQDSNGPVRLCIIGAMHTLFQFHREDGYERAMKLVEKWQQKTSKRDAQQATATGLFVQKSVAKAKVTPIVDEMWKNDIVGESQAQSASSSSSSSSM